MVRAMPSRPPNQQAATPIPPQAKPGRSRYQLSAPTGTAAAASNTIGVDTTCGEAASDPGSALGADLRSAQIDSEKSPAVLGVRGDQGMAEAAGQRTPWFGAGQRPTVVVRGRHRVHPHTGALGREHPPGRAVSRRRGSPGVGSSRPRPASARMASASRCASATRPAVRSAAEISVSNRQRRGVPPEPGCGTSVPSRVASSSAAAASPRTCRAASTHGSIDRSSRLTSQAGRTRRLGALHPAAA